MGALHARVTSLRDNPLFLIKGQVYILQMSCWQKTARPMKPNTEKNGFMIKPKTSLWV
jgi:hypothetical protein